MIMPTLLDATVMLLFCYKNIPAVARFLADATIPIIKLIATQWDISQLPKYVSTVTEENIPFHSKGLHYKTYYGRNLWISVMS
jgi:hypothetical protein